MGMLVENEADAAGMTLRMTAERMHDAEFVYPLNYADVRLFVTKTQALSYSRLSSTGCPTSPSALLSRGRSTGVRGLRSQQQSYSYQRVLR